MFYAINETWKIMAYNDELFKKEWCEIIEKDFTEEELKKIQDGYLYIDWVFIESDESRAKEKQEAIDYTYKTFNESLSMIESNYTDKERETFELKRQEAEKVIAGWESAFLSALCLEWETVSDLANKIKANSEAYQLIYASAEKELREKKEKILALNLT